MNLLSGDFKKQQKLKSAKREREREKQREGQQREEKERGKIIFFSVALYSNGQAMSRDLESNTLINKKLFFEKKFF